MLTFLRWAVRSSHLHWSDEITIAREIKEAGGLIDELPSDRFYAKNMLPCSISGEIDWSNLELAQAKEYVTTGNMSITPSMNIEPPVYLDENSLHGVLASIPALANKGTRNMLLKGFPIGPAGVIPRNPAWVTDLHNIVEAVEGWGKLDTGQWAVNVLIDNAAQMVRGTKLETKLEVFRKS
jgi:hypothetical protein